MADLAAAVEVLPSKKSRLDSTLNKRPSGVSIAIFLAALAGGLCYIALHVARDMQEVTVTSIWPYLLLALALLIALGFEFVNGFHDTANAVAMVIYTHSLEPTTAVVLSGMCNLAGVLASSGAVAFAIITLLPVELILQVSSGALESGHVVARAAGLQLAHHGGFHHRRGDRQPTVQPSHRRLRRGLGAGHQGSEGAAYLAGGWLWHRRAAHAALQMAHQIPLPLRSA
jgi:hypothetical protein